MNQNIFSKPDHRRDALEAIRLKYGILLLGLTGGIASGKSTVAHMLNEMGVPIIDFDILARQVVERGRPAWNDIVKYFGRHILLDDGAIDRKRISSIVFRDSAKRKKLEGFIHPRIDDEFINMVEEKASKNPGGILQAVVPLLIEVHMQGLFDRIILVHVPPEKQVERLMKRDGISREEATNILNAQMPIDEKVKYADFVVHNENTMQETRVQVEELWKKLIELQRMKRNPN